MEQYCPICYTMLVEKALFTSTYLSCPYCDDVGKPSQDNNRYDEYPFSDHGTRSGRFKSGPVTVFVKDAGENIVVIAGSTSQTITLPVPTRHNMSSFYTITKKRWFGSEYQLQTLPREPRKVGMSPLLVTPFGESPAMTVPGPRLDMKLWETVKIDLKSGDMVCIDGKHRWVAAIAGIYLLSSHTDGEFMVLNYTCVTGVIDTFSGQQYFPRH